MQSPDDGWKSSHPGPYSLSDLILRFFNLNSLIVRFAVRLYEYIDLNKEDSKKSGNIKIVFGGGIVEGTLTITENQSMDENLNYLL